MAFTAACCKVCEVFSLKNLNEHQVDAISHIAEKKSDVFVNLPTGFGKSLIFQALPLVFSSLTAGSRNMVIVVSPLVSLMEDQVIRLKCLGISAISLNNIQNDSELKAVLNGEFSIVYGSPELWLREERWRKMITSKAYAESVRAVAIDEAHVICHWGKSKSNKHVAFREWFSRLHELRSLVPHACFVALTATATKDTRETIFEALLMRDPYMIVENPNKENITYVVHYMKNNASLEEHFAWLSDELISLGTASTRSIIYCQTIKQCATIYSTLKSMLGDNYIDAEQKVPCKVALEMLHSCTPTANKQKILESFQSEEGSVRILVATIAFGMGVDCKQVYRTIHFGPAKNVECYIQETGRAGRDGRQSTAYLLYQGLHLMHVEKDIKGYVKTRECRRKYLMNFFDVVPGVLPQRAHLCCDNCSQHCICGQPDCKVIGYPQSRVQTPPQKPARERKVSETQRMQLKAALITYHKSLLMAVLKRDCSGRLKSFIPPKFLLGFSDIQISDVLDHCSELFSVVDICNSVEIWDLKHALEIYKMMQSVFGNMDEEGEVPDVEDVSSDEEEDLWSEEWKDLASDEELANLVIDNFSASQLDDSNLDDSNNESITDNPGNDVPLAALSALMNLSFDAIV